jgi:CheY-like chemotaxis protein
MADKGKEEEETILGLPKQQQKTSSASHGSKQPPQDRHPRAPQRHGSTCSEGTAASTSSSNPTGRRDEHKNVEPKSKKRPSSVTDTSGSRPPDVPKNSHTAAAAATALTQIYTDPSKLLALHLVDQPVWVFDIVKRAMWFANPAAVTLWNASSIEDLLGRNFKDDMSEATANRLDGYLEQFQTSFDSSSSQPHIIKEQWTYYPNGKAKTMDITSKGILIEEGRMAMLCQGERACIQDMATEPEQKWIRNIEMLRHLPIPVACADLQGNVFEQNPQDLAVFGTPTVVETNSTTSSSKAKKKAKAQPSAFVKRFVDQELGLKILQKAAAEVPVTKDQTNGTSRGDETAEKDTATSSLEGPLISLQAMQHTVFGPRRQNIQIRQTKDPMTSKPIILFSAQDITDVKGYCSKASASQAGIDSKKDHLKDSNHSMKNVISVEEKMMERFNTLRTPLHHVVGVLELLQLQHKQITLGRLPQTKPQPLSATITTEEGFQGLLQSSTQLLVRVIQDVLQEPSGPGPSTKTAMHGSNHSPIHGTSSRQNQLCSPLWSPGASVLSNSKAKEGPDDGTSGKIESTRFLPPQQQEQPLKCYQDKNLCQRSQKQNQRQESQRQHHPHAHSHHRQRIKIPQLVDDVVVSIRPQAELKNLSINVECNQTKNKRGGDETNPKSADQASSSTTGEHTEKMTKGNKQSIVVWGYPDEVGQVLGGLLHYAIKQSFIGGTITVKVQSQQSQSHKRRVRYRFQVSDTGEGLNLEQQKQCLLEDTSTSSKSAFNKSKNGGHGELQQSLLLSPCECKSLVEAMGGTLGLHSKPGRGTAFWFELPFALAKMKAVGSATFKGVGQSKQHQPYYLHSNQQSQPNPLRHDFTSGNASASSSSSLLLDPVPEEGGLHILLVDEDNVGRRVMSALLEQLGHAVSVVSSGGAMVDAVSVVEESYDVVLIETDLPLLSSTSESVRTPLEATKFIRKMGYTAESFPILALTASQPRLEYQEQGLLNDWLVKPKLIKDVQTAMTNAICNVGGASTTAGSVCTGSVNSDSCPANERSTSKFFG